MFFSPSLRAAAAWVCLPPASGWLQFFVRWLVQRFEVSSAAAAASSDFGRVAVAFAFWLSTVTLHPTVTPYLTAEVLKHSCRRGGAEEARHFPLRFVSLPLRAQAAASFRLGFPQFPFEGTELFTHDPFAFLLQRLWCERRGHRQQDRAGDGKPPLAHFHPDRHCNTADKGRDAD